MANEYVIAIEEKQSSPILSLPSKRSDPFATESQIASSKKRFRNDK
jgi:hypothetical protein